MLKRLGKFAAHVFQIEMSRKLIDVHFWKEVLDRYYELLCYYELLKTKCNN